MSVEKKIYQPEHAECSNCRHRIYRMPCKDMPAEARCVGWGCKTGPPTMEQSSMMPGGFTEPITKWPEGAGEKPTTPRLVTAPVITAVDAIGESVVDSDGNLQDNDGDAETDMETESYTRFVSAPVVAVPPVVVAAEVPEVHICCLCEAVECDGSKIIDDCAVCDACFVEFSE